MPYYDIEEVNRRANGKWISIFTAVSPNLGDAVKKLGRHVACPSHGGKNGFRLFKDANKQGTGICNTCGTHSGVNLVAFAEGITWHEALEKVALQIGVEPTVDPEYQRENNADKPKKKSFFKRIFGSSNDTAYAETMNRRDPDLVHSQENVPAATPVNEEAQIDNLSAKEKLAAKAKRAELTAMWQAAVPLEHPSARPAKLYLTNRSLFASMWENNQHIRFHPALDHYDEDYNFSGKFPAILFLILDPSGKPASIHRLYITEDGIQADVDQCKKVARVPDDTTLTGGAIRLSPVTSEVMGVAEGMETAQACELGTKIPVWSCVYATLLGGFVPPAGVKVIHIFADKDRPDTHGRCAGQFNAEKLKARLEAMGYIVFIHLPPGEIPANKKSLDWHDIWEESGRSKFPRMMNLVPQSSDLVATR